MLSRKTYIGGEMIYLFVCPTHLSFCSLRHHLFFLGSIVFVIVCNYFIFWAILVDIWMFMYIFFGRNIYFQDKTQYKKCGHYNGCIITSSPAKLECHENNLLQIYNFQSFPVSWKLKFHSTECVHHNLEKCQSCKILTDNSHECVNKYFVSQN